MLLNKIFEKFQIAVDSYSPEYEYFYYGNKDDSPAEREVGELLYSLVRITKPSLVLELGTNRGISTLCLAQGCADNKKGKVTTVELRKEFLDQAKSLFVEAGLAVFIEPTLGDSCSLTHNDIDLLFIDSDHAYNHVIKEIDTHLPRIKQNGLVVLHDTVALKDVARACDYLESKYHVGKIKFFTGRGLTVYQKL